MWRRPYLIYSAKNRKRLSERPCTRNRYTTQAGTPGGRRTIYTFLDTRHVFFCSILVRLRSHLGYKPRIFLRRFSNERDCHPKRGLYRISHVHDTATLPRKVESIGIGTSGQSGRCASRRAWVVCCSLHLHYYSRTWAFRTEWHVVRMYSDNSSWIWVPRKQKTVYLTCEDTRWTYISCVYTCIYLIHKTTIHRDVRIHL